MTSAEIRQSFLDFFRQKKHTVVLSSSLLPDAPNLLFTNAGMNQFVPIFLGQQKPPWKPPRVVDTQKCIRAGGKHNDLEDVGLDTYHHTFFEMLGNWSFGDYFKKEAIAWSWELIVERFKFPPTRVYASIYQPGPSDPSERDQEAYDLWAERFRSVGLDPDIHIVNGGKKDNFWMMGETGPCGPCSEIHIDLTPEDRPLEMEKRGATLVNGTDARCIEIWNNVFIQFNAEPATPEDAVKMQQPNAKAGVDWQQKFVPLPAKHVDTGMGFERLTSIIQGTKGFADFATANISNYETDIFRPIFDELEKMSGKRYGSTLPIIGNSGVQSGETTETCVKTTQTSGESPQTSGKTGDHSLKSTQASSQAAEVSVETTEAIGESSVHSGSAAVASDGTPVSAGQIAIDVAFRVIADHIRTLSFAIADGIQPGNTDRNYVLRRILRRAVRYGRTLGFHEPFFYKLVDVLADTMGHVFPELRAKQEHVEETIRIEEEAFNKTLDKGIALFNEEVLRNALITAAKDTGYAVVYMAVGKPVDAGGRVIGHPRPDYLQLKKGKDVVAEISSEQIANCAWRALFPGRVRVLGKDAFELYDTYGFPLDLTELMARERGLTVDVGGFNKLMDEQKARARASQKKQVIELSQVETTTPTQFVGYDKLEATAKVLEAVGVKDNSAVILDTSPFYAEMGGQVGDTGELSHGSGLWRIVNTQKAGNAWLHLLADEDSRSTEHGTRAPEPADTPPIGSTVTLTVDRPRREAIQRHHTVTHLLHWALHEVVSKDAVQKGSYVGPDKLTFDFSSASLTPQQVADVEKLVNERILENAPVSWTEIPYADAKSRKDIMQFFGEKYGDRVRVVQIGGKPQALDGYSMELCGGTHPRAPGEIGLFRLPAESAIAAGIRRIEAVSGLEAYKQANEQLPLIKTLSGKVNAPVSELEKKIESLLAQQKELERQLRAAQQKQAAETARSLVGLLLLGGSEL